MVEEIIMPRNVLIERIRQLAAVDRNAFDIYNDLQRQVDNEDLIRIFRRLAKDEARHMTVEKELLAILTEPQG